MWLNTLYTSGSLALALFATSSSASGWATFCNDDFCSEGCGTAVSVNNPGCLAQAGRRSIKLEGLNWQSVSLLYSPNGDTECGCATFCRSGLFVPNLQKDWCLMLDGDPWANSFRFINGDACPDDTCQELACYDAEDCGVA